MKARMVSELPDVFTCVRCNQTLPVIKTSGGTGYANDISAPVCYACCAEVDKEAMRLHGKTVLYVVLKDGQYKVTNWPGTLTLEPWKVSKGRHNMARTRLDVWFNFEGSTWHGVNIGDNDLLRCKRTK